MRLKNILIRRLKQYELIEEVNIYHRLLSFMLNMGSYMKQQLLILLSKMILLREKSYYERDYEYSFVKLWITKEYVGEIYGNRQLLFKKFMQ